MTRHEKNQQAYDAIANDEEIMQKATASRIDIPKVDVSSEAYKSAQEVADHVGTDKIFMVPITHDVKWCGSDYSDGYRITAKIFFYAKDLDGAKDRLKLFEKVKSKWGIHYAMSLSNTGHDVFEFGEPSEVTESEANAQIQKFIVERAKSIHDKEFVSLCDHILHLPTTAMYDEMVKSINWALNALKNMKDHEEAAKRAAWLQTPDGKAWLAKYEADKKVLDDICRKAKEAADKRRAKEQQEEENEDDVLAVLEGKSDKYPQYKDGICPVAVQGGRKFKGKGFAVGVRNRDASDLYWNGQDNEWTEAIIYDPTTGKINYANIKFCKVDTSVSNERCVEAFKKYCEDKVRSTLEWCKSKDPNKSEFELQRWAKNIIKKYHPYIDVDKYIKFDQKDVDNANERRAASTVDWALSLNEGQAKTERIIMKALARKGLNYKDYEAIISMKLELKFGHKPKVMEFGD